ncbi:MAG: CpsD/CapB family tyrosine-protein kinase [Thermoguttaceae bacterium]
MITGTADPSTKNRAPASWTLAGRLDDHCQLVLKGLGWPGREGKHAIRTLGVTSCRVGEGVSTVAAHLAAAAAARQEGRVVLVDANLSRPAATQIFGVPNSPGLFDCVIDDEPVADAVYPTAVENLHVLSSGKIQGSPARVYDAENLLEVVADLARQSALTIFDLPPVRQVSCANRLSAALDGVVLVVAAESVPWETALRVKEILTRAGAKIVGAILNKRREVA